MINNIFFYIYFAPTQVGITRRILYIQKRYILNVLAKVKRRRLRPLDNYRDHVFYTLRFWD